MLVLGIDTSTDVLHLSIANQGELLASLSLGGSRGKRPNEHSERMMPALDSLCHLAGVSPQQLEGVSAVTGPGGFTGIRTGLAVAKTLSQSLELPLVGIPSLEAMREGFTGVGLIAPMIDARRGEVFAALYRKGDNTETLIEAGLWTVETWLEAIASYEETILLVGEGALRYREQLQASNRRVLPLYSNPVALYGEKLLQEGRRDDPLALVPNYLRLPSMVIAWEKKNG